MEMKQIIYLWRRNWKHLYQYLNEDNFVRFKSKLSRSDIIWWIYEVNHVVNNKWINISRDNKFIWMIEDEQFIKECELIDKVHNSMKVSKNKKIDLNELNYIRKIYRESKDSATKNFILSEVIRYITS